MYLVNKVQHIRGNNDGFSGDKVVLFGDIETEYVNCGNEK